MKETKKLNIMYIGHERKLGGASLCLVTMASEMKKRGHKICVVLPFRHCPVYEALKKEGIKTYSVFFGWWMEPVYWGSVMKYCFHTLYNMESISVAKICRIAKKEKIDIIHSNSSVIDIGCKAALRCGIPHVWHFREFGDCDYKLFFLNGRKKSIQFIKEAGSYNIFISKALKKYYSEIKDPNHNLVIYDGVSEKYLNYKRKGTDNRIVFLISGNFQENKGQAIVAKAVKLLKEKGVEKYKVIMAGGVASTRESKRYVKKLKEFIQKEGLNCIEMAGYVSDMNALREKADVEIVPSVMEAFGRVTVEAMLSGNPVLASDTGANAELVKDNENGWLFSEGSAEALAEKMNYIIENASLIALMGERAYREAKEKYLSNRNTDRIEQTYYSILSREGIL